MKKILTEEHKRKIGEANSIALIGNKNGYKGGNTDWGVWYDPYVKTLLDEVKKNVRRDDDWLLLLDGQEGCITGDTIIRCNRATLGRKYSIQWMYNQLHGNPDKLSHFKQWDLSIPSFIRAFNGKEIRLHKIKDVVYSGIKLVYELKLTSGKSIKATLDHKIMTSEGWVELGKLDKSSHKVMVDTPRAEKSKNITSHKYRDIYLSGLKFHINGGKRNRRVCLHIALYEAHMNNMEFGEYLRILGNDEEKSLALKFVDSNIHTVHHKDGNHYNNNIDNLQLMIHEEHLHLHGKINYTNFSQGVPKYEDIESVTVVGMKNTYDIVCEEPFHNFCANEIVIHNSGKSVLAMQLARYLSPNFHIGNVCLDGKEFLEAIYNAKKYDCIVFDEAFRGLNWRSAYSNVSKMLHQVMMEMRQKNLYIIVVIPSALEVSNYVAFHRASSFIHVYKYKGSRGYYAGWGRRKKNLLLRKAKQAHTLGVGVPIDFGGRFHNQYVVDEEAYRAKKLGAFNESIKKYKKAKEKDEVEE